MALEQLTTDLFRISNWRKRNLCFWFIKNLIPLSFYLKKYFTQLKFSSVHYIFLILLIIDLSWKDRFISLCKETSKRLDDFRKVQSFFSWPQLFVLYRVVSSCTVYDLYIWVSSTFKTLIEKWSLKFFINCFSFNKYLLFLYTISITTSTASLNSLFRKDMYINISYYLIL